MSHIEVSWGFRGIGFTYSQSRDLEGGRTIAVYLAVVTLFFSQKVACEGDERSIQARIDSEYLRLQWYRGDDEMNSMPWMFQWPWKRWHHVRHERFYTAGPYPYRYELQNGEVQLVKATIAPEEREWRWMFRWMPIRRVSKYIDIRFSDEVGERAGSWKGGTIGCGYELRPNETPLQCLRRMERERIFD